MLVWVLALILPVISVCARHLWNSIELTFETTKLCEEMFSKWRDAYAQLSAFFDASLAVFAEDESKAEVAAAMERSKEMILHWFSLLSAVAVETIKHHDDEDKREKTRASK